MKIFPAKLFATKITPTLPLCLLAAALTLAGCGAMPIRPKPAAPAPAPIVTAPVATHTFTIDDSTAVVGELQVTRAQAEDTLSDIARRFNLGYEELVRANPNVDPWLPGEGREIILPTQFILPDAPRRGLVINLAELRVYYYPPAKPGEPHQVVTHPIGIGKVGWSTPEGTTKITGKKKDPVWTPPLSVRKEHAENGDPLPARVPAGPDNPLGNRMFSLGWPSYLVHGTNKPYGVGMRSSHGCIRLYPEDISLLFDQIPVGTEVHVVNQPLVYGWRGDTLYMQVVPTLEVQKEDDGVSGDKKQDKKQKIEARKDALKSAALASAGDKGGEQNGALLSAATANANDLPNPAISDRLWQQIKQHNATVDQELVNKVTVDQRGIAVPVSQHGLTLEQYVTAARHVENRIPEGATWDGTEGLLVSAEEFEATRTGKPFKPTEAAAKKPAATVPN